MSNITFSEIMAFYPKNNSSVYEELRSDCKSGRLVPFVGAGLSMFCGYQSWPEVLKQLAEYIYDAEICADVKAMIEAGELLKAAQSIQDYYPRMLKALREILDYSKIKNCGSAKLCASAVYTVPYLFRDGLVMTTNFDRVLEEVYDMCHAKFGNVITPYDADLLTQARQGNSHCLFKLHGDIGPEVADVERLVFAQAQYDKAYADDTPLMKELPQWFQNKKLLFLGCSLAMDRTMEVLQNVRARNQGMDHYAILACKPEEVQKKCIEIGRLGISAIFYPDEKHDSVRVILERLLEDTNHTAYEELNRAAQKDPVMPKAAHRFMYDSDYIAFVGRETELAQLQEFCQDSEQISWWAVAGPGGMGKSRLVYEFSNRQRAGGWKVVWLKYGDYGTLSRWMPPVEPCIVIADDVQAHFQTVGNWIASISASPRSEKLRVLLLERDGKDLDSARWAELLQSDSPYDSTISSKCYHPDFLNLGPLSDQELKDMMADFAKVSNKPLAGDEHAERLLQTLKKIDGTLHRPIYALAIVDAWCSGKDPASWSKEQILEALITRELKFYHDRIRSLSKDGVSKKMRSELESLLAKSCLGPFLPIEDVVEEEYPKLCKRADELDMTFQELLQQIGIIHEIVVQIKIEGPNESQERQIQKAVIKAVFLDCPDLIKEYLILQQAFDKKQTGLLFPEDWDNNPIQLMFLGRILRDYPEKLEENSQNWAFFFEGDPKSELPAQIYSGLLFGVTAQLRKMAKQAVDRLEKLCGQYPVDEEIAVGYANGLVNLTVEQTLEDCVQSVDKLKQLKEQFSESEEVAIRYARGLVNLTVEQTLEDCVQSVDKLKQLQEQFPESEEVAVGYAKGLVNLTATQMLRDCVQSVDKLKQLKEQFSESEEVAVEYAKSLFNLTVKQTLEDCVQSVDKLRQLKEQFTEKEEVAVLYAKGLFNLTAKQTLEDRVRSVDTLRQLYIEFSANEKVAVEYAGGLVNLSLAQVEETAVQANVKQSRELFVKFPKNVDIQSSYAMTQFNLTLKQEPDALRQTVAQIRKFLLDHPDANQEFQSELEKYFDKHPEHTERYALLKL